MGCSLPVNGIDSSDPGSKGEVPGEDEIDGGSEPGEDGREEIDGGAADSEEDGKEEIEIGGVTNKYLSLFCLVKNLSRCFQ